MSSIKSDVDRGLMLRQEIAERETELTQIEARLRADALNGQQIDLIDKEREGKQFLATGSELTVPVVITADSIIGSFKDGSKNHQNITMAAQGFLGSFYKRVVTFESIPKDGKAFRKLATELFPDGHAPAFINTCLARDKDGIPKNSIKVEWDRAAADAAKFQPQPVTA